MLWILNSNSQVVTICLIALFTFQHFAVYMPTWQRGTGNCLYHELALCMSWLGPKQSVDQLQPVGLQYIVCWLRVEKGLRSTISILVRWTSLRKKYQYQRQQCAEPKPWLYLQQSYYQNILHTSLRRNIQTGSGFHQPYYDYRQPIHKSKLAGTSSWPAARLHPALRCRMRAVLHSIHHPGVVLRQRVNNLTFTVKVGYCGRRQRV